MVSDVSRLALLHAGAEQRQPGGGVDEDGSNRREAEAGAGAVDLDDGRGDDADIYPDPDLGLADVLAQHDAHLVHLGVGDQARGVQGQPRAAHLRCLDNDYKTNETDSHTPS